MLEDNLLPAVRLHYSLDRSRGYLTMGQWPELIKELDTALELAHQLNGDEPRWKPRGGQGKVLTEDPFLSNPLSDDLVPPEDPYGDENR